MFWLLYEGDFPTTGLIDSCVFCRSITIRSTQSEDWDCCNASLLRRALLSAYSVLQLIKRRAPLTDWELSTQSWTVGVCRRKSPVTNEVSVLCCSRTRSIRKWSAPRSPLSSLPVRRPCSVPSGSTSNPITVHHRPRDESFPPMLSPHLAALSIVTEPIILLRNIS